eukprot:1616280-Rhodomonas_salina.2
MTSPPLFLHLLQRIDHPASRITRANQLMQHIPQLQQRLRIPPDPLRGLLSPINMMRSQHLMQRNISIQHSRVSRKNGTDAQRMPKKTHHKRTKAEPQQIAGSG